jgi:signal peptidase I
VTGRKEGKSKKGAFREYVEAIGVALAIALTLRYFVVEAFKIPSASMVPTLLVGDHIFVNKFIYGLRVPFTNKKVLALRTPERGEIVVFIYPHDRSKDYIKRVVGVPGDTIEVKNDELLINGVATPRHFEDSYLYADINQGCNATTFELYDEKLGGVSHALLNDKTRYPSNYGPQTIGPDEIFVMGDNRDNSSDSRVWGTVPLPNVKGKALFIWLSINRCNIRSEVKNALTDMLLLRWLRFERFFRGLH